MTYCRQESEEMWKSIAAGAIGGLVASFAMNQFQGAVSAVSESMAKRARQRYSRPEPQHQKSRDEDATVKAAKHYHPRYSTTNSRWTKRDGPAQRCIMGLE